MAHPIPRTSPQTYLSGRAALSIIRRELVTGLCENVLDRMSFDARTVAVSIYGEGCERSTNAQLQDWGVEECSHLLTAQQIPFEGSQVWVANHARATADMVLFSILNNRPADHVVLDEYMPTDAHKQSVFDLLAKALPHLTVTQRYLVEKWLARNPYEFDACFAPAQTERLQALLNVDSDYTSFLRSKADQLRLDLVFSCAQLSGKSYSQLDTQVLIEWREFAVGKSHADGEMILRYLAPVEYVLAKPSLCVDTLGELYRLLEGNLPGEVATAIHRVVASMPADPINQSLFLWAYLPKTMGDVFAVLACNLALLGNALIPNVCWWQNEQGRFLYSFLRSSLHSKLRLSNFSESVRAQLHHNQDFYVREAAHYVLTGEKPSDVI